MTYLPEILILALILGTGAAPFMVAEWASRKRLAQSHTSEANRQHLLRAEGRQGFRP
jgi:hypothetical protein